MDPDALLHPRGPLPAATYWQRRVITLLAVVLVLLALGRACSGGGDDADLTASTPTSSASPGVAAPASPSPASAAPAAPASPTPSPTPARVSGEPCRDSDLAVTATANAKEYPAGSRPRLTLVVTNRAPVACTRDLGASALELRVVSGTDRVWSSDDCAPGGRSDVVTLAPGASRSFPVTWSRTRSRPGCPAGREPAAPGTYRVIARVAGIERPGDVFSLRG